MVARCVRLHAIVSATIVTDLSFLLLAYVIEIEAKLPRPIQGVGLVLDLTGTSVQSACGKGWRFVGMCFRQRALSGCLCGCYRRLSAPLTSPLAGLHEQFWINVRDFVHVLLSDFLIPMKIQVFLIVWNIVINALVLILNG